MKVTQSNAINEWTPPRHTNDSARRAGHRADGAWRGRRNVALAPSSPQRRAGCAHPGQGLPAPSTGHRPRCDTLTRQRPARTRQNASLHFLSSPPKIQKTKQKKHSSLRGSALNQSRALAPERARPARAAPHTCKIGLQQPESHSVFPRHSVCGGGGGGGRRRDPDRGTQHGDGLRQLTVNVKFSTHHTFN